MVKQLDVYRDWLGVTEAARPLNHYQLLRLSQFEDDPAKVRAHYRKMNAHVRKFAAGEFATQSQELLNELAKAMLCLTDAKRKGEYDVTLGRAETSGRRRHTFEEILIGRKLVEPPQLEKARNFAKAVNLEIRDAVIQQKLAAPEVVMQAYAESVGLPYIDLADVGVDAELAPKVPAVLARQHSCAPVMLDGGTLLMATPNPLLPEVEDELRLRLGYPVRTVLCTASGINDAVAKYYPKEAAAAQMAAGGGAGSMQPAAVTAATPAAGQAAEAAPQLSREERKAEQRKYMMLAGFGTFPVCMLLLWLFGKHLGIKSVVLPYVISACVAGAAVAITGLIKK
jgi:MshEN domain